jgi:hypothetical protein
MTAPASCINCRFFLPMRTDTFPQADGMCRRYAPSGPIVVPSGGSWQCFPPMPSGHWCGDYRPADAAVSGRGALAA